MFAKKITAAALVAVAAAVSVSVASTASAQDAVVVASFDDWHIGNG